MKLNNLIFAHRGVHNNIDIPENSIKAFKKALDNNFNIELDVQLTKDNVLVVFHDENLKRMTGIDKNIKDLNYQDIKNIKLLNTKETIPTFKEVLNVIDGKVLLDIEIKPYNETNVICKRLVKELNNYNSPFLVKSFSPSVVRWFKINKSEYIRGLLIKDDFYNSLKGKLIIKWCKPNFLAISKKYINKFGIKKYLKEYSILIWTITNKEEITKYKGIANNYICNNIPFK